MSVLQYCCESHDVRKTRKGIKGVSPACVHVFVVLYAQVRATVAVGQAYEAMHREFEADAAAARGVCAVWE